MTIELSDGFTRALAVGAEPRAMYESTGGSDLEMLTVYRELKSSFDRAAGRLLVRVPLRDDSPRFGLHRTIVVGR